MSGRELRIVPYNGNSAYKYYLDGYKVNGKRKRLFFKDFAAANRKFAELAKRQKKEGQDGLDISLEFRVMAVKAAQRLAPFNKTVLDAAEFYAAHLERESSSILVSESLGQTLQRLRAHVAYGPHINKTNFLGLSGACAFAGGWGVLDIVPPQVESSVWLLTAE